MTSSPLSSSLKAGDEVRLVRMNRWNSQPPEAVAFGVVTRVGRRYAFADFDGGRIREFDMVTGYERGDENGNGLRVMTAELVDRERRQRDGVAFLRENGVELNSLRPLTLEQIEAIAAILRPDPKPEEG
jgi:hypothetical protein